MLGFVQSLFAPKANPIGVDFGTDALRLAQVHVDENGEHRLIAAASADVPGHVRADPAGRIVFFVEAVRELLVEGKFRGREAILALPAASMFVQHLKLPRMSEEETKKALPWEARGKLPIDPTHALLRHIIAGEIYQDQEPKNEVICLAARKDTVNAFLAAAARAKLDVVGMAVEPTAILDCFNHVYRRKSDLEATTCYIDIGAASSRAVIARYGRVLFARAIPVGGDHFTRAVAEHLKIPLDQARLLRCQAAARSEQAPAAPTTPTAVEPGAAALEENSFALLGAAVARGSTPATAIAAKPASQSPDLDAACAGPLRKLVEELTWCRRYHEATFPNAPIDRLIFIGGEARQKTLCQTVARELGMAAQLGDPMVRMARTTEVAPESGLDRRQPQPNWAVAIGLSMGGKGGVVPQPQQQSSAAPVSAGNLVTGAAAKESA